MNEVEITWKRTFAIWWLVVWRYIALELLVAIGVGAILGLIFGLLTEMSNADFDTIEQIISITTMLASPIVILVVLRMALRKKYDGFRLAMIT